MDFKAIEAAAAAAIFSRMLGRPIDWNTAPDDLLQSADWATCTEYAQAAITAYLAQREANGFVMVPVEPTEYMAYMGEGLADFVLPDGFDNTREGRMAEMASAYKTMIAARPKDGE